MCVGGCFRHIVTVGAITAFLFWTSFITGFGLLTLQEGIQGPALACNAKYHLIKYSGLNVLFEIVVILSYFLWKGGGEGARARALMIMVVHGALALWGVAVWDDMTPACIDAANKSNSQLLEFHSLCTLHNVVFFFLYLFHEVYLGDTMKADLTLFVEMTGSPGMNDYPYALPHVPQDAAYNSGVSGLVSPGMQPTADPPPHSPPHLSGLP